MDEILKDLNTKQREAVTHTEGPLIIIAGAGTGKTKVITRRIAYLIAKKEAKPEEILALTFTDKAAEEMEERVDLLVPYGYVNVWISTFHSFGAKILRDYGLEIGIDTGFRILTPPEAVIFVREHLFDLPLSYYRPLGNPTKFINALVNLISRTKDEDVTPEEYLNYANSISCREQACLFPTDDFAEKSLEIAKCYADYERLLAENGLVDMAGLITLPLKLLRTRPNILEKLQNRFRYILVDEFQDTNYAQFQLVKLLSAKHRNITVTGDDDQSIYKFRGAAISNILSYTEEYPDTKEVVLKKNYRSTQIILDTARRLITQNTNRLETKRNIDKRIIGRKAEGLKVEHFHYDTIESEADSVARMIEERKNDRGYSYNDFAILVRTNFIADPFLRSLNMRDIPWKFTGNQGLYDTEEIKLLMNFLHVISNINDTSSLYGVASSDLYGIDPVDLVRCIGYANRKKRSLWYVFSRVDDNGDISDTGKEKIKHLLKDMEYYIRLSTTSSAGKVIYKFLHRTKWLETLATDPKNERILKNIAKFLEIVQRLGETIKRDRVPFMSSYLDLLKESGDNPPVAEAEFDVDAVNVLTVHKAKGLEFKVVFLASLVSQIFPHDRKSEQIELPDELIKEPIPGGDFHIEEERRLFYVGMTRTKDELILTSSRDHGGKKPKKVSQFVIEALDLRKEEIIPQKTAPLKMIERYGLVKEKEVDYITVSGGMLVLSPLQIDDYLTCPLKYKYIHRIRMPLPKHHAIIYGSAIHKSVANYFKLRMEGKRVSFEDIVRVFENSWVSEGFLTREHEERRFAQGKETLRRFFEKEEKKTTLPTYVEERFSFRLDDVKIEGRWDRVDMLDEGGVIIDYKTGDVRDKKKADTKARQSVQLSIYGLGYKERFGTFPLRLELHFLDTGVVGELKKVEKYTEKVEETIAKVVKGIREKEFDPSPSYFACEYCAYRGICSYSKG